MVEPLTKEERIRFAFWLESQAKDSQLLLQQLEKMGPSVVEVVKRERAEMMSALVIARKLRAVEDVTLDGGM
jgi:hypothetical protein